MRRYDCPAFFPERHPIESQAAASMSPCPRVILQKAIARALRADGFYVGEVESLATQALVDAQWAAHVAARSVGVQVAAVIRHDKSDGQLARAVLCVAVRRTADGSRRLTETGSDRERKGARASALEGVY